MKINNLNDLFLDQMRDMYSAETQSIDALKKMIDATTDKKLRGRFEKHLQETHGHVEKLENVFKILDEKPKGHRCKAMAGIIEEINDTLSCGAPPAVMDAGLIAGERRIEHYEIAAYESAIELADELKQDKIKNLLKEILADEKKTDKKLSKREEAIIEKEGEKE